MHIYGENQKLFSVLSQKTKNVNQISMSTQFTLQFQTKHKVTVKSSVCDTGDHEKVYDEQYD